jgi:hypothetical protein
MCRCQRRMRVCSRHQWRIFGSRRRRRLSSSISGPRSLRQYAALFPSHAAGSNLSRYFSRLSAKVNDLIHHLHSRFPGPSAVGDGRWNCGGRRASRGCHILFQRSRYLLMALDSIDASFFIDELGSTLVRHGRRGIFDVNSVACSQLPSSPAC